VTPLAPQRFGLQVTLDQETHDLLRRAQALMSHQVRTGEILPVLNGALRCFVAQLEKQKYAATRCPRPSKPGSAARHIPAAVKRAVRERDGDQCAFVSESGQRCSARSMLEFDHAEPVARGGAATVENVRLVCRAHNLYAAERAFGAEFMEQRRRGPRYRRAPSRPPRST
jgi:5-methylcytosine-specific restriction endonuclease McrA